MKNNLYPKLINQDMSWTKRYTISSVYERQLKGFLVNFQRPTILSLVSFVAQ